MAPPLRVPTRCFDLICGIACLGAALCFPASTGWAQAQTQPPASDSLAAQINAEFQAVKERAVHVRLELPRLDQALEAFAAHLKDRADLSDVAKAAALARVEQARAVLRRHDETLRRAAARLNAAKEPTSVGQEIDALAELLNVEGDQSAEKPDVIAGRISDRFYRQETQA